MKILIAFAAVLLALPAQAAPDWKAALEGEHRSETSRQRDQYRHPRETLEFFGIQPDMTVVEISPGAGWYTEVLAPLLRDRGTLYAAHAALNPPHPYYRRALGGYLTMLGKNGDVFDQVVVTQLQPPLMAETAPAGTADMVLTFRNLHNWMQSETAEQVLEAAHRALKPGGVLGLVEHRARPGTGLKAMIKSGYVTEAHAVALAESVGFKLAGRSEVNANPDDVADHPKGVWTLPPSLRLGDERRQHYLSIGESDRMTLKFVKP